MGRDELIGMDSQFNSELNSTTVEADIAEEDIKTEDAELRDIETEVAVHSPVRALGVLIATGGFHGKPGAGFPVQAGLSDEGKIAASSSPW